MQSDKLIINLKTHKNMDYFEINGDIAQSMIDDAYLQEYEEQMGIHDEQYYLNFETQNYGKDI